MDRLIRLARDQTARDTLGVDDGVLAEQVDISFLEDPIDYLAFDLATALMSVDADEPSLEVPPLLATLVGEVRLCQSLLGSVDEDALVRRALDYLREAGSS